MAMDELGRKKTELFKVAMEGKWGEVIKMYKDERALHTAKITASGDTALHMAVSNGDEKVVEKMVELVCKESAPEAQMEEEVATVVEIVSEESIVTGERVGEKSGALEAEDERKNTPLHLAASMGYFKICKIISGVDPSLVGKRNIEGETPLFLAALHGHKQTFLWLHHISNPSSPPSISNCRRNNGDTILHCAIRGEHFDLAIEIIHLYEGLVQVVRLNEEGLSPLDLLAAMPSAFKSGSRLGPFEYLIYHCTIVKKIKADSQLFELEGEDKQSVIKSRPNLIVFPAGWREIRKKKEMHTCSVQIMDQLLHGAFGIGYLHYGDGRTPDSAISTAVGTPLEKPSTSSKKQEDNVRKSRGTPLLIAAKNGVIEMVERILELFPGAINDKDDEKKNIVLLAVEKRQTQVYQLLLKKWGTLKESLFRHVDEEGNSALHLAARLGDKVGFIHGEDLQMQWEIKWFKFVKTSVPPEFFVRYNHKFETPNDVFWETHRELVKKGEQRLSKTSQACSVLSTLVATVAFATSTTLPGGVRENTGYPKLENEPVFSLYAISSLVALCTSVTSTVLFLSILTSRYQALSFQRDLPRKLLLGLTTLFLSITSMWITFCAGHFFAVKNQFRHAALPIYLVASFPVTFFGIAQFPLYFDLLKATFTTVPEPSHKATPAIEYRKIKNKETVQIETTETKHKTT